MGLFPQLAANGIVQGALVACLAAGFGFVYRSFRVFHVAMGAQFVASSYAFYAGAVLLGLPTWAAAAFSLVVSMVFALLVECAVYRPFSEKGCSGGVTMVASLGVLIVTENALALAFGNEVKTIPHPPPETFGFGGVRLSSPQLAQFAVSSALFAAVGLLTAKNRRAKAAWALGDEPELVRALGLPVGSVRRFVVCTGALLVAAPAMLVSADVGMDPHEGMRWLLIASVAAFFGGRDHYWAWGAGAFVLGVAQALATWLFPACWSDVVAFALLLAVMAVRPRGLFGGAKRPEESA